MAAGARFNSCALAEVGMRTTEQFMSFRIAARTLIHLGSELISSDGIALYELIKNAYDADSATVQITVMAALPRNVQRDALQAIAKVADPGRATPANTAMLRRLTADVLAAVVAGAPNAGKVRDGLRNCRTLSQLEDVVEEANVLVVADEGRGMSLRDLDEAFLTIGTRSKLKEKATRSSGDKALLGEKGIGRLSAMRLGSRLEVRSATARDRRWALLDIDWSVFDHASDQELGSIAIAPHEGAAKSAPGVSGTRITIRALRRGWTKEYLEELAAKEFSRLNDPFRKAARFPIVVSHNADVIPVPRIDKWIFEHAHARCEASFRIEPEGSPRLSGRMSYGRSEEAFVSNGAELLSISKAPGLDVMAVLGPFEVEFLWYNRRILTELDGVGTLAEVRAKLAYWTGGIMMFRDDFRVLPYGSSDDDWLDLDRRALARSGFKLNRAQLVGRVAITQRGNPELKDQANREGLVDNEEKRALREILAHLVQETFWSFLVRVEKRAAAAEPVSGTAIERRLEAEDARLSRNVSLLVERVPAIRQEAAVMSEIRDGIAQIQDVMGSVRQMSREYEEGRRQLLGLAGVGLTVEILAHELNRAAETALATLANVATAGLPLATDRSLKLLAAQLKALQKRLRILDPLSTAGRNRKEKVDVVQLAKDVIDAHADQFVREGIRSSLTVLPTVSSRLTVTVVPGMIVQVLENLVANSLYWLRQQARVDASFAPMIAITVDAANKLLRFSDNGPGIASSEREAVFEAFYTKKPSGEGKGLGLFICREIAKYHGAGLALEEGGDGVLRDFVLDMGEVK